MATADVKATRKSRWNLSGILADRAEDFLSFFHPKSYKTNKYLEGNHGPVPEAKAVDTAVEVQGVLPACLNGEFVRNGPNPRFHPPGGYHWFDGDGMLHGVRIKDGKASYVNRYVKTNRYKEEEATGGPKFLKLGDLEGKLGLGKLMLVKWRESSGVVNSAPGGGTANTAMAFHSKQLLALNEVDVPYVIKILQDGDLETLGTQHYNGKLNHSFTAHPKVDPTTGEMFGFSYQRAPPFLLYCVIDKEGNLVRDIPLTLPDPVMMHDFAITENYAVFMDLPLVFSPKRMAKGNYAFHFDATRNSRFGVLPRYAKDESDIKWFELPPFYIFHSVNAWEEGDEIVLFACKYKKFELTLGLGRKDADYDVDIHVWEFRFNLKTGEAKERQLMDIKSEFPRVNETLLGRKTKFGYAGIMDSGFGGDITGMVKFDMSNSGGDPVAGVVKFGAGRFGGEPVFVPRTEDPNAAEDDGYLVTFVYDKSKDKSDFVVLDAKTMSSDPIAVVKLNTRVPYGFHGIFVTEAQLQDQKLL